MYRRMYTFIFTISRLSSSFLLGLGAVLERDVFVVFSEHGRGGVDGGRPLKGQGRVRVVRGESEGGPLRIQKFGAGKCFVVDSAREPMVDLVAFLSQLPDLKRILNLLKTCLSPEVKIDFKF